MLWVLLVGGALVLAALARRRTATGRPHQPERQLWRDDDDLDELQRQQLADQQWMWDQQWHMSDPTHDFGHD